jgi:ribosomal protein S18 acetylase RimI-like enzyme
LNLIRKKQTRKREGETNKTTLVHGADSFPMAPPSATIRRAQASSSGSDMHSLVQIAASARTPALVEHHRGDELPATLRRQAVDLLARNMRGFCGSSWDEQSKREDLCHQETRVVAVRSGKQLLGFASYRLTHEEGAYVAYIYELQVEAFARGMRLGSGLVREVEQLGRTGGAAGIMLTVHTANHAARRFYTGGLHFETSPISPSACAPPVIAERCGYEVMQWMWDDDARRKLERRGAAARRVNFVDAIDSGTFRVRLVMRKKGRNGFPEQDDADGVPSDTTEARETKRARHK